MNIPKYLYHYTNLESLILILKNKTIRFNPLDQLDDMDESTFDNFDKASKYIFVSSWTREHEEMISFWNMYTRDMHGVRIRLPFDPFEKYKYNEHLPGINGKIKEFYLPYEEIDQKNYCIFPFMGDTFAYNIEYTEDEDKLYSKIIELTENSVQFHLGKMGAYKREAWHFQEEWRYRLVAMPMPLNLYNKKDGIKMLLKRMEEGYDIPLSHIDLHIKPEVMKDMEIMAGPKMTDGEYEILKLMVQTYLPTAEIIKSNLKIR